MSSRERSGKQDNRSHREYEGEDEAEYQISVGKTVDRAKAGGFLF